MPSITACLKSSVIGLSVASTVAIYAAWKLYPIIDSGELYLENAPGEVSILREADTAILHIRANDWPSMSYGSGFASAQNRLWQMHRTRILASGRLSEMFGSFAHPIDEFMRLSGVRDYSQQTWDAGLEPEFAQILQSYADGVNDYVAGVALLGPEQHTDRLLPPEFLALGYSVSNWEPWTPVDSLSVLRLMSLHLTWSWQSDLHREILRKLHPDIGALAEEIFPFTGDMTIKKDSATINDDELKEQGRYSETTLSEIYRQNTAHIASAAAFKPEVEYSSDKKSNPKLKAHKDRIDGYLGSDVPLLGEPMASNAYVVSGEHTDTGMPILENDPHLANQVPCQHMLASLEFNDGRVLSGSMIPGWPSIMIGRSNHLVWGFTASRADTSDLWEETLNEDSTEYLVDGEWLPLDISETVIKTFMGADVILPVKRTHRGNLISFKTLKTNSALLFGSGVPNVPDNGKYYSFAWQGQFIGEDSMGLTKAIFESKDLHEFFDKFDNQPLGQSYKGVGQNTLLADDSGNIGFRMLTTMPERKDKTPFIGNRILDGTTSKHDWTGEVVPMKDMPKLMNPKSGYITSANGRQTSDHALTDYGSTINTHARQRKIDRVLKKKTESGEKFTYQDALDLMHDVSIPNGGFHRQIRLLKQEAHHLTADEQEDLAKALAVFEDWEFKLTADDTRGSLYQRWAWEGKNSFFRPITQGKRTSYGYHFLDFNNRLYNSIEKEGEDSIYQEVCRGYDESYTGNNPCEYNRAKTLVFSYRWHVKKISANPEDWTWGSMRTNEYVNLPWSKIPGPINWFFHRSVPAEGNASTVSVSKIRESDWNSVKLPGIASANLKMISAIAKDPKDDKTFVSIDTGMNGNPFQGHYFDLNEKHMKGELLPLKWTEQKLEGTPVNVLTLKPKSELGKNTGPKTVTTGQQDL